MRKMRALLKPIWLSWPAEVTLGPRASADPGAGHPGDEGVRERQCALTVIYRLLTRSPHSHLPAKHSTINPQSHLPLVGTSPCVAHLREAGRVGGGLVQNGRLLATTLALFATLTAFPAHAADIVAN